MAEPDVSAAASARRWFPALPPSMAPPAASAMEEAAFDAFVDDVLWRLGVLSAVVMIACTVMWWPLDAWVMPAEHAEAFSALRVRALAVELTCLVVFLALRPQGRALRVLAAGFPALLLFAMASALGRLGAAGEPWLANAWMGVVPAAFIPLRFGPRVVATVVIAAALPAGFFLPHPGVADNLDTALGQLSFGAFSIVFTVIIGEVWFRVLRSVFFERMAVQRAKGELEAMAERLSALVQERTEDLRALTRHLSAVQESERRQLARDLHDDLGQNLTAMRYAVARMERRVPSLPTAEEREAMAELIEDLYALLDGTTTTVRDVVSTLRPRILDDLGLEAATEWLCERVAATGVDCELSTEADDDWLVVPAAVGLVAFRALQEATTNALRHGRPARIDVRLTLASGTLRLEVADDGAGFVPADATPGFGLLGLRERVRDAGGALTVTSAPGEGTLISLALPCQMEVVP